MAAFSLLSRSFYRILGHGGLELVAGAAKKRLVRDPFLRPDLACVEAALRCFKSVCNNAEGLAAFVDARAREAGCVLRVLFRALLLDFSAAGSFGRYPPIARHKFGGDVCHRRAGRATGV